MIRLPRPDVDDATILLALSNNDQLLSYPSLQPHVRAIQAAYAQYIHVGGDLSRIQTVPLPPDVGAHLRGHYSSPSRDLFFIDELRAGGELSRCPMCGSAAGGSLDHMMPKQPHPAFSIFSLNLVPACKCNFRRGTLTVGANPGERLLHPYFDDVLNERLLTVRFGDLGIAPSITLEILTPESHPDAVAVRFHVDKIVRSTQIIRHLSKEWSKLITTPGRTTIAFRNNPADEAALVEILEAERERKDFDGPNTWDSIFFSGLLDPAVTRWLFQRFNRPGRGPGEPLIT